VLAGRYELDSVIGIGATAAVYSSWDRVGRRAVAVKLFAAGVDDLGRRRQHRELAMLARLEHPALVTLLDAGAQDGRSFLVMQLVDGPSLEHRLAEAAMPPGAAVGLGEALAQALAYVHAQGVTHRDVKPANVLLRHDGRPLLVDFGIALLVDVTRVTASGAVVGTAAYLAPEQIRGDPVGPPADVYALGLVLIEALTGRRAYPGTTAEAVLARLHHPPPLPEGIPDDLAALLHSMTLEQPDRRPTARAVARRLHAIDVGAAAATSTPPAPVRRRAPLIARWPWRRGRTLHSAPALITGSRR
jgi:serine/threonine protein kinase